MRKGSGASGAGLYQNVIHHQQLHHHHHHNPHPHHPHLLHQSSSSTTIGGGPSIIPPHHLQQQFHHPHPLSQQQPSQQHSHHLQHHQQGNMVQQRANSGGGNGGRIYLNNHHPQHPSQAGGNPYLQHQGAGIILQHQQHHAAAHHPGQMGSGGGPSALPLQLHHSIHHHSQRPLIPHGGAGFGPHPSGMGQGLNLSGSQHGQYGGQVVSSTGINSHFGTSGGGAGGSVGGRQNDLVGGAGHSSSGGGDLPPVETVVARLETACRLLHGIGGNNTRVAEISSEIQILSEDLRRVGAMLENTYPEVLDRVMSSMRDASAQPCLPPSLRLAIFELVELRASKWILPSDSSNYYRQRRNLNDAAAPADSLLDERSSGRSSAASAAGGGSSQVTVVVTGVTPAGAAGVTVNNNNSPPGNPIKPEAIFPGSCSPTGSNQVDLDTPPQPQPAKTYREEIVIKNSDSGKVAPTAKERVLSINGYSQQSINLAKQLIQETITRNASPVLDGMVLPGSTSPAGAASDFPELSNALMDDTELALKRMQLQSTASSGTGGVSGVAQSSSKLLDHGAPHHSSSHFSYTVTLGEHSIRILGDDLQYVQEAKMALDDYFLQKYPDLFSANMNGIEDVEEEIEEEDEDFQEDQTSCQRYDRETLLSLSKVTTPPPNFSHLEPDIRGVIVLEKPRQFDLEKFARETNSSSVPIPMPTTTTTASSSKTTSVQASSSSPSNNQTSAASNTTSGSKATSNSDVLPG